MKGFVCRIQIEGFLDDKFCTNKLVCAQLSQYFASSGFGWLWLTADFFERGFWDVVSHQIIACDLNSSSTHSNFWLAGDEKENCVKHKVISLSVKPRGFCERVQKNQQHLKRSWYNLSGSALLQWLPAYLLACSLSGFAEDLQSRSLGFAHLTSTSSPQCRLADNLSNFEMLQRISKKWIFVWSVI